MSPRTQLAFAWVLALLLGALAAGLVRVRSAALTKSTVAAAELSPEMERLLKAVQTRLSGGGRTEADFAPELAGLEAHLNASRRDRPEEATQVLALQGSLFLELGAPERSRTLIRRIKTEFPGSTLATEVETIIAAIDRRVAAEQARAGLVVGAAFPDFSEKDTAGRPLSLGALRGRVVLVDFWATWCGPCVAEAPNVVRVYEKFHPQGFEIVGVSLDRRGEGATVDRFIRQHGMTWPQFFDGGHWDNKLAVKYGVNSIPATYLLDRTGRIIGRDLRGAELDAAIARALAE
jgi:peroxiredoxin